jgi:hypothetical protein
MPFMTNTLYSASDVIDALGGNVETAKLTNRKDSGVVWNWRKAGRLPRDTFLIISAELERVGKYAPPSLWGMAEPEQSGEAA